MKLPQDLPAFFLASVSFQVLAAMQMRCFRTQMMIRNGTIFFAPRGFCLLNPKRRKLRRIRLFLCQKKQLNRNREAVSCTVQIILQQRNALKFLAQKQLAELNLDELDELEDSEDEAILLEYRRKRIAEMTAAAERSKFGTLLEISGQDYVKEVNKAGEGIWVVLHLYKQGQVIFNTATFIVRTLFIFRIPLCSLINQYLQTLAAKYPTVKFIRAISTTCIPNFPDKNLPGIFIYFEGELKKQLIGPLEFRGMNMTPDGMRKFWLVQNFIQKLSLQSSNTLLEKQVQYQLTLKKIPGQRFAISCSLIQLMPITIGNK